MITRASVPQNSASIGEANALAIENI